MVNVLSEEKKQQVLALGRLSWSLRRIEQETGVRRETASRYLKAAGVELRGARCRRAPDSKAASQVSTGSGPDSKAASEVSTDLEGPGTASAAASERSPPAPTRRATVSLCEPYRETIELGLSRGRNAMAIWQDLVDEQGFVGRYSSVKRFVAHSRGTGSPEAFCVIVTAAGEEAQVDYGTGPMVRDPKTGKYRRTRLFVMTLGYSRKSVRLLCWRSGSREWSELHEQAFRRLGGATRTVVLDNLREGVIKPDVYDATLNPLFRDVLAHYGVVALPCRVRDPNRKGKVESGVGHAKRTPLKGMHFESLEEAQAYLDRWEARWADTRIQGTTKRQVSAMFAEEQPALLALPIEPFRYYQHGMRTVHLDGYVEVEAAYYAPPPGWIGKQVAVQWDGSRVRILDPKSGELLREHRRAERGWRRIQEPDRPSRTPTTTHKLLARAGLAGQSIGVLCNEIHVRHGEVGVRRILGVLALAKKHGAVLVEDACVAAIELGVFDYRFVRKWVDRHPACKLTLRQVDPLIRELTHYRNFIDKKTEKETS